MLNKWYNLVKLDLKRDAYFEYITICLPSTHKTGKSMLPILAAAVSSTDKLAKFEILLNEQNSFYVENSLQIIGRIRKGFLEDDEIFV